MNIKNTGKILMWLLLLTTAVLFTTSISSCGKAGNATPQGLNIQYHVLNLSPDIRQVQLFINNQSVAGQDIFGVDGGYFYLPSLALPFQIRSAVYQGVTYFTRNDILQSGAKYTLYIVGSKATGDDTTLFTVDTSATPRLGTGQLRFVNVSPSATGGLDVYANGTQAFKGVIYKKVSGPVTLPVGNYDIQVDAAGTTTILHELPSITIQDGRLYTLYAYGYTSRADSAAFNAAITINR